jgi:uncharacterized secreted protein with C-terminal beta-propeller domain
LVTALGAIACTGPSTKHGAPPPAAPPASVQPAAGPAALLTPFSSCADARNSLQQAATLAMAAPATSQPTDQNPSQNPQQNSAADTAQAGAAPPMSAYAKTSDSPAAPDHSTTNIAETGVDEPDIVKTDGNRIVSLRRGWLYVADPKTKTMVGGVPIGAPNSTTAPTAPQADQQLLLVGDKALVLGRDSNNQTAAVLVDITGAPRVLDMFTIAGDYLDARLVGSTARVVIHSAPRFTQSDDWLPSYSSRSSGSGTVGCDHISHPAVYSGTSMLTLLTFDLSSPVLGSGRPLTVVADGDVVYATGARLYVANDLSRWQRVPLPAPLPGPIGGTVQNAPARVPAAHTELYEFDISGNGQPRYVAAGTVPGWPLNQYSMSEYQGNIRIATTTGTSSSLYVLATDARTAGLRQIGALTGLGHGERLYAVRYLGPTAYLVTFRQTDPLFTIDLRDPTAPKTAGELKLTGYSAYLHPVDDKTLIGLGQAANAEGVVQGTQVSLFDVSDPAAPALRARFILPGAHSTAENDPHAFLYWPKTGMLVLPLAGSSVARDGGSGGALVLHVGVDSITETGIVRPHGGLGVLGGLGGLQDGSGPGVLGGSGDVQRITRALVVDDTLWTVSGAGLAASNGATLADIGWIPYP